MVNPSVVVEISGCVSRRVRREMSVVLIWSNPTDGGAKEGWHKRCQEISYAFRKSVLDMPDCVHIVLSVDAFSLEWPGIVSGVTLPSEFSRLMATWLPSRTIWNPSA